MVAGPDAGRLASAGDDPVAGSRGDYSEKRGAASGQLEAPSRTRARSTAHV
jgi:hypothetical protein